MATYVSSNTTLNVSAQEYVTNVDYILWQMNSKLFARRLPAVIFVGLLAIVGSVGNGLVICIYRNHLHKSTVNVFIFWLGIFDFGLCSIQMPYKVFDISFPLMYGYPVLCKGFGFYEIFISMVSIILLLCIAFDRYFVVRRPLKRLTMENINRIIALCILLALLFSWPTFLVYGQQRTKTNIPGVYSWGCGVANAMMGSKFTPFWYYFLYAVFAVACVILITLYVRIWQSIRKWKYTAIGESMSTPTHKPVPSVGLSRASTLYHKPLTVIAPGMGPKTCSADKLQCNSFKSSAEQTPNTSEENESPPQKDTFAQLAGTSVEIQTEMPADEGESGGSSTDRSSGTATTMKTADSCELGKLINPMITLTAPQTARLVKHARMRRNTLIFGAIALMFVLSYLPILTIVFLKTSGWYSLKDATLWQAQLAEVCHRSGYINNAVNPFIYGFLSPWFRVQVRLIFK